MTLMYDSVNINDIPANAAVVASYVDGAYANTAAAFTKFPHAQHVTITVFGSLAAQVADVETGDLTPASGALWAHNKILNGQRPTIYCNASTRPSVVSALSKYNLEFVRDVDSWVAQYDGVPTVPAGTVAKQYEGNTAQGVDISVTNNVWPAAVVTPPAPVPPRPLPKVSTNMATAVPTGGQLIVRPDGGVFAEAGARFYGSLPGLKVTVNNIVGVAPTKTGNGYWLVGSDGGVFCFGDAGYHGSAPGNPNWGIGTATNPVVGIALDEAHENGYVLVSDSGSGAPGTYYCNETTNYK